MASTNSTKPHEFDPNLIKTYNATLPTSQEELCVFYDQWASTYDEDYKQFGYEGPRLTAETSAQFLQDKYAKILDFGAGTGMVGKQLQLQGFCNVDAIDMSSESLKICEEKQLYKLFICAKIGSTPLDIKDDTYDALVACGCFFPGHLNQSCFPEMIRITKPGGLIVITMREEFLWTAEEYKDRKFENAIQDKIDEGKWEVLSKKAHKNYVHDKPGIVFVFKIA